MNEIDADFDQQHGTLAMTKESEQALFDRWSETEDRAEYISLTMKLFPKVSKEKAEKMADALNL